MAGPVGRLILEVGAFLLTAGAELLAFRFVRLSAAGKNLFAVGFVRLGADVLALRIFPFALRFIALAVPFE